MRRMIRPLALVGCLLGALLLALAESLPTVLSLSDGTSFLLTGALTLLALVIYTRGVGSAVLAFTPNSIAGP